MFRSLPAVAALASFGSVAHAGSIAASGYASGPDGGPATADVAATVYNPAALGGLAGWHVLADGQLNFVHVEAESTRNDGIDPNTGEPYNLAVAEPMVPNLLVGAAGEVWKDRIAVGLTLNTPFIGGGDYSGNETNPPPYKSHQRYFGIDVAIIRLAVTPAIAVTPVEGVHVGGGAVWFRDTISAVQASDTMGYEGYNNFAGVDADPAYGTDSVLSAEASGTGWGYNGGIFVDRWRFAQVGVSYSGATTYFAEGDGTVDIPSLLGAEAVTLDGVVSFEQKMPAILRAGLTSEVNEKLTLGGVWEYQMWNQCCEGKDGDLIITVTDPDGNALVSPLGTEVATTQYSPRRLGASSNFMAWGSYGLMDDKMRVLVRGGFQQNAVPDFSVSPTNLDFQSVGAMAAVRYNVAGPLTLGLGYTRFILFERNVTDSAWGEYDTGAGNYVDDRFSPGDFSARPFGGPYKVSANGNYRGYDNVLAVRLQVDI